MLITLYGGGYCINTFFTHGCLLLVCDLVFRSNGHPEGHSCHVCCVVA